MTAISQENLPAPDHRRSCCRGTALVRNPTVTPKTRLTAPPPADPGDQGEHGPTRGRAAQVPPGWLWEPESHSSFLQTPVSYGVEKVGL